MMRWVGGLISAFSLLLACASPKTGSFATRPSPGTSLPTLKPTPIGREAERHLLDRLTFGSSAADLQELRKLGLEQWLDRQLHPKLPDPSAEVALAPYREALSPP